MPIADILAANLARLDSATLLSLIMQEDAARRRAIKAGDFESAIQHQRERNALVSQWESIR